MSIDKTVLPLQTSKTPIPTFAAIQDQICVRAIRASHYEPRNALTWAQNFLLFENHKGQLLAQALDDAAASLEDSARRMRAIRDNSFLIPFMEALTDLTPTDKRWAQTKKVLASDSLAGLLLPHAKTYRSMAKVQRLDGFSLKKAEGYCQRLPLILRHQDTPGWDAIRELLKHHALGQRRVQSGKDGNENTGLSLKSFQRTKKLLDEGVLPKATSLLRELALS